MFYYPTVLKRHTGCFTTIWLAATKGIKVSRRDYLEVNVKRTCDDIMDYVLVRMPPPQPGLPRPRFSLYLSSQLQYGVIVVYHKQCHILLGEIQATVERLTKYKTSEKISLDDKDGPSHCVLDALLLMTEMEGALDPLFGVMTMGEALPSPRTLTQMSDRFVGTLLPERTPPQSSLSVSPESITLRETQPVTRPAPGVAEMELPDFQTEMIELLLGQGDEFMEEGRDVGGEREPVAMAEPEEDTARELQRAEVDTERERTKEITGSTVLLQPTTASSEDAFLLPQDDSGPPAEPRSALTGQVTAVAPAAHTPSLPGLEELGTPAGRSSPLLGEVLEPVEEQLQLRRRGDGAGKTRRRRQLIFFDPDTQLRSEELKRRMSDPLLETQRAVLPSTATHRLLPAAHLLTEPCNFLPEEIRLLWRQAATITPVSGSDLQAGERAAESTESERDTEAQREQDNQELQSVETFRRMAHSPMSDVSGQSFHSLETSDKVLAREISPLVTPESKVSPMSGSVSRLQDIPEEVDINVAEPSFSVDLPGPIQPELPDTEETYLLFRTLMPPLADRKTVSTCFWSLLEKVTSRTLRVEQDEPYGDIRIFPGSSNDKGLSSECLYS